MNMHSKKTKLWKRGVSLLLAALTVFNLSSQGLILTAHALGGREVEAPEISVTFSPEQLPGSMANQVSDRVYMLPTKAEMSLQLTLQPGYTKGYATGAYVRMELPYFYINNAGQIIVTDEKPSGVPENKIMGVEAKVVGDTGNWIVDTTAGEPAPVETLVMPETPEVAGPEQDAATPVAEELKQDAATPVAEELKQDAATPVAEEPKQDAATPVAEDPKQDATAPVVTELEQTTEPPEETEPEQSTEPPAVAEPTQRMDAPAATAPQQIPEPVVDPVDDGEGYRRGVLQIVAANEMVHLDPKPLSFTVSLRFFGDVPENVTGSVRLGAGYEHYYDEAGNASADGYQVVPGSSSEKDIHAIDIVNSNLQWDYSINQVGKSVLWDKYNYVTYHVKIANTSGSDTTSKIDKFTLILTVQSYQNTPGEGGVLEKDMMQWEYNPDGDPILNEDYGPDSRDKNFVGVPNEGGVLVHDVTDMTQEERDNLDLEHFTNLGETMPYHYSLPGVIGVDIAEDQGELVPEHMANGADKRSYREYYISVPYANNLRGSTTTGTVYRPTVYFGGRNVPWTKQVKINGEFVKRAPDFAHEKYVLGTDGSKLEEKEVPIGGMDTYYLGGFHNIGNVPAFRPVVTDTLPEDFQEKRIDLILDPDTTGAPCDLTSCFQPEPIDFVFEDGKGEVHYVTATEMGIGPSHTVDPDTQVTTYSYQIANAAQTYLDRNPDLADWTFSRKFRVHLREELGVDVVLPGRVAVVGEAPLPKNFVNTIDTDYVTKYWQPDTAQAEAHYEEEDKQVAADTATLVAMVTAPQVDGHGVLRKNGKETVGAVGEYQRVPFNENASALRYVLANNSPSVMKPAVLQIGPLVNQKEGANNGFFGNEIRISKELLSVGVLREIVLTDAAGRDVTFSVGSLPVHESGDILISQEQWEKEDSSFGKLSDVELRFDRFDGNVSVAQNAAIDIRGVLTERGNYQAGAEWHTQYGIPELSDKERSAHGDACLNAISAEPFVTATAHSGDKQGNTVDILFRDKGYYQFIAENRSETSIGHSEVAVDLQSVQDMDPSRDVRVQGFRTEQIFIDHSYVNAGKVNRIELYDWNQNAEEDKAKVVLTLDELLQYKDEQGNLMIPKEAFQNIECLKFVRVMFDDFYGNAMAPTADHPDNTAFVIQLHGSAEWLDTLTARGTLIPREEFYGPQYSVSSDAHFRVERSYQDIHSHIYYNNVTEEISSYSGNSDSNRTSLAVPYDRDFVFRNELVNKSRYTLDDVDSVFTMPITKSQDGGFHTTAIRLYTDLLQNYAEFETITITDVKGKQLVLTYDVTAGVFKNGDAEIGEWNTNYVQFNAEEFHLGDIRKVMLTGKGFAYTGDPAEEGKQFYVEFCGFEDAPLGSDWYQLAESTHYVDGVRNIDAYQLKKNDDSHVYVSKMYFDTIITAGYNDHEPNKKFSAVTTPLEDVREGSDGYVHNCVPKWGDNSELEVGYKALGSFMVDFRQYLNVGTEYPTGAYEQEHSGMPYVKLESLNTAANVEIKVDLPHEYFDTYYIKVDPRAKGYLNSMTVIRANGATEVISADDMQWSAVEIGENGAPFCRLNLVKEDSATRYTNVESDFYKEPKDYDAGNPVKRVVLNLDINQEAAHQDENGDMISNLPDYGTWYEDKDESSKYMFEFTGRFYQMEAEPNHKGQVYATADAKLTIGGGRSRERVETSGGYDSKSDWSFKNYYRYYYYDYYSCYWSQKLYRAANLYSKTYVHVMRDQANVIKGATTSPSNQSNTNAYFGMDNQYQISFFRTSAEDTLYATTGVPAGKTWYEDHYSNNEYDYQDSSDWSGKIGYADEIILRDNLPPLRPDDEYGFYGFKTTGLELKPELSRYLSSIELKVWDVDKEGNKTNPHTVTVDASELIDEQGTKILKFSYATEETEGENPEPTVADGTLNLALGQFVESFDVHIKNLLGNGHYTKELGSKGTPDFHGSSTELDMIVHGMPYVIHTKDPNEDGTNRMMAINKVDYEDTEYTNSWDDALLMGYLIKMIPGYRLEYTNPDRNMTDYAADNVTPNVAEFGVEIWNDRNNGSNEGMDKRARISRATVNNTMNTDYRLQHIYLPKFLVEGNWFRAKDLILTINGKEHAVSLDQVDLKESSKYSDSYEIDVEQIIRDHGYTVEYSNQQTDYKPYEKAYVSSFTLTFEALHASAEDGTTVLEHGEYLTADRQKGYSYRYDGVYVDRNKEEFRQDVWTEESTPTFGKKPDVNRTHTMMNTITPKFDSVDVNADIYHNPVSPGTQASDYYVLRNLAAVMGLSVTRNTATGFAYDLDKESETRHEVDQDHLLPYDYIEYTATISNGADADISLNNPTLHFLAPEGQQVVSWEFVSSTDAEITADDLSGVLQTGEKGLPAVNGADYSLTADSEDALHRGLNVTVNHRIAQGCEVVIRIKTQLLPEPADAYDGRWVSTEMWLTAEHTHSYPQYMIHGRTDGTLGYFTSSYDLGGTTSYYRNVTGASNVAPEYEIRATNSLRFFPNTNTMQVSYTFDDAGYSYDNQAATICVTGIQNDTEHDLESIITTVSFIDANGYQGFALTQAPNISYPESLPADAKRADVKIEYWCDEKSGWIVGDGTETEEFLRTVKQIRWTYDRVNAEDNSGGMPQFDEVKLIGVGLYADIREDNSGAEMAENYHFISNAEIERNHHHQEEKQVGDPAVKLDQDRMVTLNGQPTFDLTIFRENPEVDFYTQVFNTAEDAENAGLNRDAAQKRGYRPGETMWQKLTLHNLHMVNDYGTQIHDQGVVLNPVFYDKLPEYLSSEDLANGQFHVIWKDINGAIKNTDLTLISEEIQKVQEKDYGGGFIYPKSNGSMSTYYGRGFDDFTPSADNTKDINFTVYKLSFRSKDGSDVRMEVGDTIEIWYSVTAREDHLPMVFVDEDRNLATVNDQHPGYFPRMGEYYSRGDYFAQPLLPGLSGTTRVDNANRQMDLDYLLHDIGFSADKNEQVDRWEFLNGSHTLIPGSNSNSNSWTDNEYGSNNTLFDQDINEANDHQYVDYRGTRSLNGKNDRDKMPESVSYGINGYARDWWNKVLSQRTKFEQKWDGQKEDTTPILWSQTRLHLQKAWLVTASEMIGSNVRYEISNPNYPASGSWTDSFRKMTQDQNRTALEYDERFLIAMHALNYGDWDLDGVEFTYIMPRGIEPQVKDGSYGITAQILSAVTGAGSESYEAIQPENVIVEVLQSPETGFKGYSAPDQVQDPLWTAPENLSYYAEDGLNTVPWVFKITVKHPLTKWFNRGSDAGYKLKVDIPSHVYLNNEAEAWYDRVITRPYVAPDSQNHYYYQIMDIDHWEGSTRTTPHNQIYGMDYMWYYNNHYEYLYGSPNTPYLGGYNIQNNEVVKGTDETMGKATDNTYADYATAGKLDLYAQTGTAAVMRKPFVRLWATVGDDLTGATQRDYYTDIEGQRNRINIHVENKYWWDELAFNGDYYYGYQKYLHNYETDGGSRGTLFAPVITNVLPFGVTPVAKDGTLFSTDNTANATKELEWYLYDRDVHSGADVRQITEAEAAEMNKYDVSVTYEQVPCYDEAGEVVERTEGRYVIHIVPKQATDCSAPDQEVRLASQDALIFSIMTFTEQSPRIDTDKKGVQEDLRKNYQDNRTYLGSRLPGFKFIVDEDLANNPYKVGSYAYSEYYAREIDPRLDAVKKEYSWGYRGNIPDDYLNHTYEFQRPLLGEQKRFMETDVHNVEDYCALEHPAKDLNYQALLTPEQKDFNANGSNTHLDAKPDQPYSDIGVMNTLKIRTATPRLAVESLVAASKEENGISQGEVERPFQYSEDVWFSAKIQNAPSSSSAYEEMGGIRHAKMVVSFYLPESVSYSGTAQWNVQNNDGDSYNNPDDYYVEYNDPTTQQTYQLTEVEMREAGWGVEVIDINNSEQWDQENETHGGQVVTFEITTPKTEGFTDYQSYIRGEKPSGYIPSGAILNFKIRTRVDNLPKDVSLENGAVWENGDHAEVYVTMHDTDGRFALRENGTFINEDAYQAGERPASGAYNGFEIEFDGHKFHQQKQEVVTWVTDSGIISDEKDDSDALTVDHTVDGIYDVRHVMDDSGFFTIQKPHATVRLDTGKLRPRVNDPDSDRVITEDPHVKSAYTMTMRLDQAVNQAANVNTFIVNYNIPYYGTGEGTPEPAPAVELNKLKQTISKLRTGMWELPEGLDPERAAVLADHMKVYVYVLRLEDPAAENGAYYYPGSDDYKMAEADGANGWKILGNEQGYALTDNAEIDIHPADQQHIYEIRWVVKTESFTDAATGLTYTEEQVPIYYPVPAGFRLDVDADDAAPGKQEMDDVDPDRVNKDEPTENVKANSAFIEINTNKVDTEGVFKHTNHFATVFAKYDDVKYTSISNRARAGYYVDPELPTVNLCIRPMYFSGNVTKGYKWKNDLNVDPQTSKVLKYRVGYENLGPEVEDISIDNATDPTITVATPYVATLNENRFEYVAYQDYTPEEAAAQDYYIGDTYQSNRNLDTVVPQWTWYLKDTDGSIKPPDCPEVANQIQLAGEPEFVRKAIDGGTNMRTIVNYHFAGYLKPGQTVYVDMMVPIEELEGNAVPVDMLQCKAFGFKKGNFDPYIQPGSSFDNLNYEYDTNDVNNNGNQKDMAITRLTNAIVFKSTESIVQNKSVTTELDSNVTGRAVPVPEGKDFEYKISIINKSASSEYNQLVLYDVLPYENDFNIKNLTSQGEKIARDSKWNGWIRPNSLRVLSYMPGVDGQTEETEVDSSRYEIWVGPIVRNGGGFEVKQVTDLPTQERLNTQEFFNQLCGSTAEKEKYFVRLSEVQAMPEGAEKDAVVRGIRAVWVQMDENYLLSASERLRLSFEMHTPLNLPVYKGTLDTTPTNPNSPNNDYNQKVQEYTAWNTFVSRWNRDITEQARAGAYPNAPSGRGYIGSYVWHDLDYSGVPDSGEGEYGQEAKTGRIHLNQATVDLDFDGVPDDPGVNGVKVQLLNENGFLVNREGQAIAQAEDGKYILIDPVTGEPSLVENPDGVVVYQYSKYGGPVEYVTESDYYGREGYFILSNLLPGSYRLRYTFPEAYKTSSVTTTKLGADQATGITVYRDGKVIYGDKNTPVSDKNPIVQDRLIVQTDLIKVEPVAEDTDEAFRAYDQKMTAYNVGVALGHFYGGTVWLDETDHDGHIESDGYLADSEPTLGNVEVTVYDTADLTKPCLDADSNPAVFTTGEDGQYLFRLKPGHEYLIAVKDLDDQRLLKPTPWTFTNDPTEADGDNDLSDVGAAYQTKVFTAKVPLDASGKPIYQDEHTHTYQAQTNIDLGLINAGRGYLGKFVWDDSNYNGIMDANEKGIPGVVLTLESYYMDDQNQWVSLGERDVTTNAAGAYVFENVMSYHTIDGVRYLTGYKMRIDPAKNPGLYETYAITHYQANGTPDSDLISKPDSENRYYLSEDYIIIAIDANEHTTDENRRSYGGKNYDISDAKIILDYDAGFTKYEYGQVSGMIWEDNGADANRYNGILDQDETGLANVKVYLEQYVKGADGNYQKVTNGVAADGTAYTDGLTVVTDAQGEYHFNAVPLFVRIDGTPKLCYYRIRAELPDDSYAVTRYRQDETQTDSHWITDQYPDSENYLTTPEEDYFLMAQQAGDLQNGPYTDKDGKTVYDIVHADAPVTGYDGGILRYETATVEGIVWNDADYDGIQDPEESGIYNQEVLLERYYYDGAQWQKDDGFATASAWTTADGVYTFNGLQTHVMVNGQTYLAGYRLQLKQLPTGYAVSRYMMGDDRTKDSDLLADTLALVRDEEYLILAKEAVGDVNQVESYTVRELNDSFHDGTHYDLLTAQNHAGQDGGIKQLPSDQITGRIWEDLDYNGIRNDGEPAIQGQNVLLERFYYDNGHWTKDDSASVFTAVTGADGVYTFTGLQTYVMVDGKLHLAGYQLKLDQIPSHFAVTLYREGEDRTVDSDLDRHDLTLQREGEYLILADHAEKNTVDGVYSSTAVTVKDAYHESEVFDVLTSQPVQHQDGGLTSSESGVISGIIWDDFNYNGVREDSEYRIPGVSVKISCDYYDADAKEWKPYERFAEATVLTDDAGVYTFSGLESYAIIDGQTRLLGYTVQVESIPAGYDVTRYRVGNDRAVDSDLRYNNLKLVRNGEYLVLLNEAKDSFSSNVTITDADGRKVTYDLTSVKRSVNGQDGGLVNHSQHSFASLTGRIWDDHTYNGIQDTGETGVPGVEVELKSFYYDGTQWQAADSVAAPVTTTTDEGGVYRFDSLASYVEVGGQKYLAGYQVTVVDPDVFNHYDITYYQVGDDKVVDSDLRHEDHALVKPGEYLILAQEATAEGDQFNHTAVIVNDEYHNGVTYDYLTAQSVSGQDGGLVNYSQHSFASLTGRIWDDQNYNGIQDSDEIGVPDVKVTLTASYYDGTQWQAADDIVAPVTAVTGEDGVYRFDNLLSYIQVGDQKYLAGYQVTVVDPDVFNHYDITYYQVGDDKTVDSDLRHEDHALVQPGEHLILAQEATAEGDQFNHTTVTVNDEYHSGVTYDYLTAQSVSGQDGGLVNYSQHSFASLTGRIWDDQNYNGIQDAEELGVAGVTVTLTTSYYDGTQWQKADSFAAPVTAVTGDDGVYRFDNLPTFVDVDGQKYLAGYQVAVDDTTILKTYGITYYHVGEDKAVDSDLRYEDYALVQPGEYLILAQEAKTAGDKLNHTTVTVNDEYHNGVTYDYLTAHDVSGQDGGLVMYGMASLTGRIWDDRNYNGIQDTEELGVAGVTVVLKTSYYDGTQWQEADSFAAPVTAVTGEDGVYRFDNLPVYVQIDGQKYLAGYQVAVDDTTVPETYGITYYQVGNDKAVDSDLRYEDYALVQTGEYLILAQEAVMQADGSYNYTTVTVNDEYHTDVTYDLLTAHDVSGQDGGLVTYGLASLTGRIWDDQNYDGIQNKKELGVPGVTVTLTTSYYDGTQWQAADNIVAPATTVTGEDGVYRFDNLPSYVQVGDQKYLAGYQVTVDDTTVPETYGITYYQVGNDKAVDSDLRYEDYALVQTGEYLILAQEAVMQADGSYNYTTVTVNDEYHTDVTYDLLTAHDVSGQDGGLVTYGLASLTGRIWDDRNYDGIQNKKELGVPGVTVTLTTSYYDGTQWQAASDIVAPATTVTGEDGVYRFDNLPSYVQVGDQKYLAGYQVTVDSTTVPDTYGITYYHVGKDKTVDSDLRYEDYALVQPGEYLIMAQEAKTEGGQLNHTTVTVNDEYHDGITYDYLTAHDVSGQDGGLVTYGKASLTGRIWEDQNYNGIQDAEEIGVPNVTVALKTSYYDGTQWQEADSFAAPATTETGEDGVYRFDNLPSYVEVGDQKYLAGYQVAVDNTTVPETYGITYYQVGEDKTVDSDLRYEDYALVQPGEYLIMAQEAVMQEDGSYNYTTVTVHDEYHDGITYDLLTAHDVSGQDGGLTLMEDASLSGRIWEDQNYNGIQDLEEPGISGVEVNLSRFYLVDGEWMLDESDVAKVDTDENGVYLFEHLPVFVEKDETRYLAGYQVNVTTMSEDWAVTRYRQGINEMTDSDLRLNGMLVRDGEYIPVAQYSDAELTNDPYTVTATDLDGFTDTYDLLKGRHVEGQDGGLTAFENGSISGTVWVDKDMDGIINHHESGMAGVNVELTQFIRKDGEWIPVEDFHAVQTTDADGFYNFDHLPVFLKETNEDGEIVRYLTGYRLQVEKLPEAYKITAFRQNDGVDDSKILADSLRLIEPSRELDGCLVIAGPTYPEISMLDSMDTAGGAFYQQEDFDLTKAVNIDQMNAGIWKPSVQPQTGDDFNVIAMSGMFFASGLLGLMLVLKKRRKSES